MWTIQFRWTDKRPERSYTHEGESWFICAWNYANVDGTWFLEEAIEHMVSSEWHPHGTVRLYNIETHEEIPGDMFTLNRANP